MKKQQLDKLAAPKLDQKHQVSLISWKQINEMLK